MKKGFTLAEVLLTLAVIGIVAAITLPSLLVDTTEKAFDAQRRALHARLAQAIGMMSTLSGYGQYIEEVKDEDGATTTEGKDDAAETFLYEGLSKVYKMNNICDSDNLDKCAIPSSITTMAGENISFPKKLSELNPKLIFVGKDAAGDDIDHSASDIMTTDTKVAAFETVNGESIAVFYNPNCKNNTESSSYVDSVGAAFYMQNKMCVNFVYDLNGTKGPNKVGRDIGFISAIGAKNSEVAAPLPFETNAVEDLRSWEESVEICANYSDDSRLPNRYEQASMFYNASLIGNLPSHSYSSSVISKDLIWRQDFNNGFQRRLAKSYSSYVRCVRK